MYFSGKDLKCTLGQAPGSGLLLLRYFAYSYHHKVLTYVEYRTVSGVFQNIDPHPPLRPASMSSPRTKGGGYTLAGRRGAGGGSIFWKTPAWDWPLTV